MECTPSGELDGKLCIAVHAHIWLVVGIYLYIYIYTGVDLPVLSLSVQE